MRALIIDDEPLAREGIRLMLGDESDVEIAGECGDGFQAVAAIRNLKPDLIFLDIEMPGMDGFRVLESLEGDDLPGIIFITAYDRHAIRAFDVCALDYLLKPVRKDRLLRAVDRARRQTAKESGVSRKILSLLEEINQRQEYLDRLVIKTDGRVFFLPVEEIDWIEASNNYVTVHTGNSSHLMRRTIGNLESHLDPKFFRRVNRSAIINMASIREMQSWFKGEYKIILKDGTDLMLTRNYRDRIPELSGSGI